MRIPFSISYLGYLKYLTNRGVLAGLLVLVLVLYAYSFTHPKEVYHETTVPLAVEVIPKGYIKLPDGMVLVPDKKKASKALDLPDEIAKDDTKQVLTAAECPPSDHKIVYVPIIDTVSGETKVYSKIKPLTFISSRPLTTKWEFGARWGATDEGTAYDVYGRYTLFRLGSFHFAGYGEVNTNQHWKAMLDVTYRREMR